ncbi:MAG: hypothetical protein ACKOYC_02820, partial [Bacteroidota bacterium]
MNIQKNLNSNLRLIILMFCFSILYTGVAVAQDKGYLEVVGSVNQDKKALEGAEIIVMRGDEKVESLITNSKGNFIVNLELNSQYLIVYKKGGCVTKSVEFDTKVPEELNNQIFSLKYKIELFAKADNLPEPETLAKPVAKYEFNDDYEDFTYDPNYTNTRKEENTKAKQEMQAALEKQKIEDDKVKAKAKADSLAAVNLARIEQEKAKAEQDRLKREEEARVKEQERVKALEIARQKSIEDSIARLRQAEELAMQRQMQKAREDSIAKAQEDERLRLMAELKAKKEAEEKEK